MLLAKHSLVSDQVSPQQVRVILGELEKVLQHSVPGAVVEFGCYIGTTSLFIRRLLDEHSNLNQDDRQFHAYDSFEGLPEKTAADTSRAGEQFRAGELAVSKKMFRLTDCFRTATKLCSARRKLRLCTPPVIHPAEFVI